MTIIGINGSPRKNWNRGTLRAKALKGAAVELVDLGKLRIGFCQACETCHRGPDCMLNDDGRALLAKVLEADGLVLASPVYLSQVTAQMKALLDRTSHFMHCLRLIGKYMATVTTSGGGGVDEVENRTGLDFFSVLPNDMENQLEAQVPKRIW